MEARERLGAIRLAVWGDADQVKRAMGSGGDMIDDLDTAIAALGMSGGDNG